MSLYSRLSRAKPDFKKTLLSAHTYRFMLISFILRLLIEIGIFSGLNKFPLNTFAKF